MNKPALNHGLPWQIHRCTYRRGSSLRIWRSPCIFCRLSQEHRLVDRDRGRTLADRQGSDSYNRRPSTCAHRSPSCNETSCRSVESTVSHHLSFCLPLFWQLRRRLWQKEQVSFLVFEDSIWIWVDFFDNQSSEKRSFIAPKEDFFRGARRYDSGTHG